MKQKLLLKVMLLLCALVAGSSSVWAVDQVYKSLTFPDDNSASNGLTTAQYESTWTATIGTTSWTIVNFNNNNWANSWTFIKCGRKKGKSANTPSVASITTSAAIDEAITKVVVTLTAINASDYNSIKLYMASNSDFDANLETFTVTPIPTAAGDMTITIPEAKRAANRFYKLEFDTKGSGSSNGHTVISQVDYYYNYVSSATLSSIALSGTYPTEFYVGDTFSHEGQTVTATYSDASTVDVTTSATYSVPDMSTPGTKTITVSFEENSVTKTATYDITVSPVPPVVLTLDFTTNILNLPTDGTTTETGYTYGGYTYTLAAPDAYFWQKSGVHYVLMGKTGATFKFPAYPFVVKRIKVYGRSDASASSKFNIYVGDDAICTEVTSSKVDHMFNIPSAKQAAGTVYTIKSTANYNIQITKIELYGDDAAPAFVGASGWSTLYCTAGLDFAKVDGLEAYVVSAVSASSVTLSDAIPHAPAGTAVILKGTPNTAYRVPVLENNYDFGTNKLLVSDGSVTGGDGIYALAEKESVVGFYKVKNTVTIPAGKCYLNTAAGAPDFLGFGGDATGIDEVRGKTEEVRGEFYNLAGQRVAQPTKGLYIVNGKKVVMK